MATPPSSFWQRRGAFSLYELLGSWWRHRASFVISIVITVGALGVYVLTYIAEHPSPALVFIERLELNALDTRFRFRPLRYSPPDPRIIIVDIDQRSQEVLGKWPFSRTYFAKMLDAIREDGAKVAAFDITFDKADQTGAPVRKIWADIEERKNRGEAFDRKYETWMKGLLAEYDTDSQFAEAIKRFGPVVLGNFFLPKAESQGVTEETLNQYADLIQWYAIGNRNALSATTGKQDFLALVQRYQDLDLVPAGTVANIPALTSALNEEKAATGFFNISSDVDGVLRRSLLVLPYGRSKDFAEWDLYGSLEVQTVRLYLGVAPEKLTVNYSPTGIVSVEFGDKLQVRPDSVGRLPINYRGPERTYPYISIADVVTGRFKAGTFRDKIVLVGASATGIGDLRTPPYGGITYPGVEVHANVIDNILNHGSLVRGANQELLDLALILFFGIPVGIWMALVSPRWMWFGLALLVPLITLDYLAFLRSYWLNFSVPAMTLTANVVAVSLYRALIEEKEKRRVRSAFGQYLSPEVIRRLLVNPRLVDPKKTDITVMFSDIRGFTTISEKLDAQELAVFLNQYLSDMTQIVFEYQGTLDKYIGDAVMAFWGAPFEEAGHAERGCNTALDMMKRVRMMQKKWEAEGKPHLDIGIGLNTGVASVGNMGSALRYGYTALGDAVNLSSRLEGLNKEYGTHIIVNETTYEKAKDAGFVFRVLDLIRVKGKLEPVVIYELVGRQSEIGSNGAGEGWSERLAMFAEARELYRLRDWGGAQAAFQTILDRWPEDGPSRMYWKRCQEYLFDEPPVGWDGVFTMTHK